MHTQHIYVYFSHFEIERGKRVPHRQYPKGGQRGSGGQTPARVTGRQHCHWGCIFNVKPSFQHKGT